jgi:hypothetical protein
MYKAVHLILEHARALRMPPYFHLASISAAICLLYWCEGTARSDEQPNHTSQPNRDYYFGRTTDKTHVTITMAPDGESNDFDIPKSYLTFSPTWRGGLQDTVVIEFVLSTLAALSETNKSTSDPDAVIVHLISREKSLTFVRFSELIDGNEAALWKKVGEIQNEFAVYINKLDVNRYQDTHSFVEEYFVPMGDKPHYPVYFGCFRSTNAPKVGCTGHSLLAAGILMDYQFRREKLPEWRKIDDSVRGLLNAFAVKKPM